MYLATVPFHIAMWLQNADKNITKTFADGRLCASVAKLTVKLRSIVSSLCIVKLLIFLFKIFIIAVLC